MIHTNVQTLLTSVLSSPNKFNFSNNILILNLLFVSVLYPAKLAHSQSVPSNPFRNTQLLIFYFFTFLVFFSASLAMQNIF